MLETLGQMRIEASRKVLKKTDLALVILEPTEKLDAVEIELLESLKHEKPRFLVIINKCEDKAAPESLLKEIESYGVKGIQVSARLNQGIKELKRNSIQGKLKDFDAGTIIGDLVQPGQVVVLVVPIDLACP